jgi:hypothetical protein
MERIPRNAKSLLGQLNLKTNPFYDSSSFKRYNERPWDIAVYTGLIGQCINASSQEVSYIPILDRQVEEARWIDFDTWWNMVVIKDERKNIFSRKDLVLNMADKDGGVHIDPVITEKYAAISRQNSLGWRGSMNSASYKPIPYPERAAIRQIAHEVLKSIIPDYTISVDIGEAYFVAYNIAVMYEPLKKKIGRNEVCPCGSGRKYKHCHGNN